MTTVFSLDQLQAISEKRTVHQIVECDISQRQDGSFYIDYYVRTRGALQLLKRGTIPFIGKELAECYIKSLDTKRVLFTFSYVLRRDGACTQ